MVDAHDSAGADRSSVERGLAATEAFSLLANETRMAILLALWENHGPQSFTDLAENAGIADTGNFNYHLGKLTGQFVMSRENGYDLTRAGRRALTAVLAEDLTALPRMERTTVDRSCPYCDATVEIVPVDDDLRVCCTNCEGVFGGTTTSIRTDTPHPDSTITIVPLPTAGLRDRTPEEILDVGVAWSIQRALSFARGACPECSGTVRTRIEVCPDHDDRGICDACSRRISGRVDFHCDTCQNGMVTNLTIVALLDSQVLGFFDRHGYDLLRPSFEDGGALISSSETVLSEDPLAYEATWTFDGDELTVRIDDALDVEVVR
ncbi:winged helix-turn-helix domain-containing protein [Natronorarus salvus]|uniref:winged helix-turn-helix domain-containing protein n=1 Tax=Natronorarus salvus TaxID=3117733 RepID=UPI002F2672FB